MAEASDGYTDHQVPMPMFNISSQAPSIQTSNRFNALPAYTEDEDEAVVDVPSADQIEWPELLASVSKPMSKDCSLKVGKTLKTKKVKWTRVNP